MDFFDRHLCLTMHRALIPGAEPSDMYTLHAAGARIDAVDEHGCTALHIAAAAGHNVSVEWLLAHGADPGAQSTVDRRTPLHFAASGGHVGTCELILRSQSDVARALNVADAAGLTAAEVAAAANRLDVVRALLTALARPHATCSQTPALAAQPGAVGVQGGMYGPPAAQGLIATRGSPTARRMAWQRGLAPPLLHSPARSSTVGSVYNHIKTP